MAVVCGCGVVVMVVVCGCGVVVMDLMVVVVGCGCGLWLLYSELLLQSGGSFTCGIARRSSSIISILILFVF